MTISTEETSVERLQALCLRWNKAASAAGAAGSEYVDSPERVFETLAHHRRINAKMAHRKGELGLNLADEGKMLADFAGSLKLFKRPVHASPYTFNDGQMREVTERPNGCDYRLPRLTAEDLTATDWEEVPE